MRALVTLAILIGTASAACAESNGPVIAIPGRVGVPVIINGVDASYSVVEGDWGLDKGVHYQPTVYGGRPVEPMPPVGHYYPSAGHLPGYGRLEIESADKPKPAPSFHQSWTSESKPQLPEVPANPPPVIMAPQFNQDSIEQNFSGPERRDPRGPQQRP
jgi:hypothetical protein